MNKFFEKFDVITGKYIVWVRKHKFWGIILSIVIIAISFPLLISIFIAKSIKTDETKNWVTPVASLILVIGLILNIGYITTIQTKKEDKTSSAVEQVSTDDETVSTETISTEVTTTEATTTTAISTTLPPTTTTRVIATQAPATQAPVTQAQSGKSYYQNCTDVWNTIGRPIHSNDPGYTTPKLDKDGDGTACETDPR